MHFVYVLYSLKDKKLYKGYTNSISKRLLKHNSGGSKSTAKRKPFIIAHIEEFENKKNALIREKYLKTIEGGAKLKTFLQQQNILNANFKLNIAVDMA